MNAYNTVISLLWSKMGKLKKLAVIIIAFGILSFCIYFVYRERFQIASRIWQIRHRGLMSFAGYSIPVPSNWYVQNEDGESVGMLRFDYSPLPTDAGIHPRAKITFMNEPPIVDIEKWTSLASAPFKKIDAEPAKRSIITADGETFSCVGGNMPPPPVESFPRMVGWSCRSSGNLEILFTGTEADINESWDILSRIRRATRH